MATRQATYHTGDEPIDGYRLVDFLGAGQFGEVWKAADLQTGRQVAIKFIDLTHSPSALKEVKAFNLVKQLNHPNLVPIVTARLQDRNNRPVSFDDAQDTARMKLRQVQLKDLIIVMGLGEKSLAARLKELNPDGTPPGQLRGLPVDELLEYMDGAARGIDYLNKPVHNLPAGVPDGPIVHCDIKPDNMMIVSGQVQIADCGVAVVVTADVRKTQAAGSPAYSPVELTLNRPGPYTDQYSLAVSYYEMRTGKLPFPDDISAMEVMIRHQRGELDFGDPQLSDGERKVLRYATAPKADQRYPSCTDFVKQLRRAADGLKPLSAAEVSRPKLPSDPSTARPPSEPKGPFADRPGGSMVDFSDIPPTDHGEPEPPPRIGLHTAGSVGEYVVDDRPVGESGIVGPGRPRSRPVVGGLLETTMPTAEQKGALTSTPGLGGTLPVLPGVGTPPAGLKKWLLVGAGAGALTLGAVATGMYVIPGIISPAGPNLDELSRQVRVKVAVGTPEAFADARRTLDGVEKVVPPDWLKGEKAHLLDGLKAAFGQHTGKRTRTEFLKAVALPPAARGLDEAGDAWAKQAEQALLPDAARAVADGLAAEGTEAGFDDARNFAKEAGEALGGDWYSKEKERINGLASAVVTRLVEQDPPQEALAQTFIRQQRTATPQWKAAELARVTASLANAKKRGPFVKEQEDNLVATLIKPGAVEGFNDARGRTVRPPETFTADTRDAYEEWRKQVRAQVDEAALTALRQQLASAAVPADGLRAGRLFVDAQFGPEAAANWPAPDDAKTWKTRADGVLKQRAAELYRQGLPAKGEPPADALKKLQAARATAPELAKAAGVEFDTAAADKAAVADVLTAALAAPPPDGPDRAAKLTESVRAVRGLIAALPAGTANDLSGQVTDTAVAWFQQLADAATTPPGLKQTYEFAAAALPPAAAPKEWKESVRPKLGERATAVLDGILNAKADTPAAAVAQVAAGRRFLAGPDAPMDWKAAGLDGWLAMATAKVDAAPKARVSKYLEMKSSAGFNDAWLFLRELPDAEKAKVTAESQRVQQAALAALTDALPKFKDPAADGLAFVSVLKDAPETFKTEAVKKIAGPAAGYAKTLLGDGSPKPVAILREYVEKHRLALGKDWADPLLVAANVGEANWTIDDKLKDETAAAVDAANGYIKSRKGQLPADWEPAAAARVKTVQDGRDLVLKPIETLLSKDTLKDLDEAERQAERTLVGAKFAADLAGVKRRLPGLREDVQDKELRAVVKRLADDKQPAADKLAAALAEFKEPDRQRKFAARVVGMASQPGQAGWQPVAAVELKNRRLLDTLEPDAKKRTAEWHYRHLATTVGEPARAGLKGLAAGGSAADAKAALDRLSAELAAAAAVPAWKDAPADPELTRLAGLGQAWRAAEADKAGLRPLKELLLKGLAGEYAPALRRQYVTAAKAHVPDPTARVPDLRELRDALSGADRKAFDADFQPVLTEAVQQLVRKDVPAKDELERLVGKDAEGNRWAAVALAEVDRNAPVPAGESGELGEYARYVSAVRAADPATAADALAKVYEKPDAVPDVLKAAGRKKAAGERIAAACDGPLEVRFTEAGPVVEAKSEKRTPGWLATAAALTDDELVLARAAVAGDMAAAGKLKLPAEQVPDWQPPIRVAGWKPLSLAERVVVGIKLADARPVGDERTGALAAAAGLLVRWYDAERIALDNMFLAEPPTDDMKRVSAQYTALREPVWALLQKWYEPGGKTLAHHRITLAVGRIVTERPKTVYAKFLADSWKAADASVRAHAAATRPDEYGTAALLGMNRLFVMYDGKEGTAEDLAAIWGRVFELAGRALQAKPDDYAANLAIGTLLQNLQVYPDKYKSVAEAAAGGEGGAAVKRMTPADSVMLWAAIEGHFRKTADHPPSVWVPTLHYEHAQALFRYTTERVGFNRLDKDQVHAAMTEVVARGQRAVEQRYGTPAVVHKLMGIAAEDAAWQGARSDEFPAALRHLADAQTKALAAETAAALDRKADARLTRFLIDVDRGRCLYRAGVFGANRDRTAEAVSVLSALSEPDDLAALLAHPEGKGAVAVAEARYWRANALWAAGQEKAAAAAFRAVTEVPKAADTAWAWKAVYDGGRLAAARRADGASADLRKAAEVLTAGKHFRYDEVLLALADVLDDKPELAAKQLEPMAFTLLQKSNQDGFGDLRATEPFQHAMLVLTDLWAKKVYGPLPEADRTKLAEAFVEARKKYPWLLPGKDQPPGVKSISY